MTDRTELLRAVAERAPAFPVFVYGPAGWGKTTYAEAFRQHFGWSRTFDRLDAQARVGSVADHDVKPPHAPFVRLIDNRFDLRPVLPAPAPSVSELQRQCRHTDQSGDRHTDQRYPMRPVSLLAGHTPSCAAVTFSTSTPPENRSNLDYEEQNP